MDDRARTAHQSAAWNGHMKWSTQCEGVEGPQRSQCGTGNPAGFADVEYEKGEIADLRSATKAFRDEPESIGDPRDQQPLASV